MSESIAPKHAKASSGRVTVKEVKFVLNMITIGLSICLTLACIALKANDLWTAFAPSSGLILDRILDIFI